jgi:creatinine amidohydrolase
MAARPYIIAETNWKAVHETDFEVAVLPWGATEAHNYHLPYATDNYQVGHVSAAAAKIAWEAGAKVGVLPAIPFGVNTGQLDITFCVNMSPSTQAGVLRDIGEALAMQGIPKLVVVNGHGGNCFKQMMRELQAENPEVFFSTLNWWKAVDTARYFDEPGDHAGELETSCLQFLQPDLVRPLEEAGDGSTNPSRLKAIRDGVAWAPRDWLQATNDTGDGDPKASKPEKGEKFLRACSARIGEYLVELAEANTEDLYERPS